jgi:tetratricopeptide (TPR) repeat protein
MEAARLFDNLGNHTHMITTNDPQAQRYFNQGLILSYAFNHEEAIRSFQEATRLDPQCAMCYWGIAFALGPNINAPMADTAVPDAYAAIQQAQKLAGGASAPEQAYIAALAKRYSATPTADRAPLDSAFADAMREVSKTYPDDLDAATILAEALMNLTPWNYWTKDGQPTEYTNEIVATLESVMARDPNHPGANHYYVHAVEASQTPERAVPSAERLASLVPGAGHLVHMPAHIYWRVGRYQDAIVANQHAVHSDETYMPERPVRSWYSALYYPHNIHFLFAATSMSGQSAQALEAANKLVAEVPESVYQELPLFEDFRPMPLFALLRFGKWDAILSAPQPPAEYQYTTGVWHYARGIAYTRTGKLEQAAAEQASLLEIAQKPEMEALILQSFAPASANLEIAAHTLGGELAGAQGKPDQQIAELEQAVKLQDQQAYIEPPAWYYPVRQSLGAALLKADHPAEAEAVYREDLKQYPLNGWSLFGLAQSLRAQGKTEEAAKAQQQFETAWSHADVTLSASQF